MTTNRTKNKTKPDKLEIIFLWVLSFVFMLVWFFVKLLNVLYYFSKELLNAFPSAFAL